MAKYIRSLRFNLEDGIDIPNHRTHRSKKGQNRFNKPTSLAYFKFKKKKKEKSTEDNEDFLALD